MSLSYEGVAVTVPASGHLQEWRCFATSCSTKITSGVKDRIAERLFRLRGVNVFSDSCAGCLHVFKQPDACWSTLEPAIVQIFQHELRLIEYHDVILVSDKRSSDQDESLICNILV